MIPLANEQSVLYDKNTCTNSKRFPRVSCRAFVNTDVFLKPLYAIGPSNMKLVT